jgi:hypothetical protein
MQWNMAALKHGSDAHAELLAASVALLQPDALAANLVLDSNEGGGAADRSAMRANDPFRPDNRL